MAGYDIYILIICLIVFIELTALFAVMLRYIIKKTIQTIEHGLEDDRITTEYYKEKQCNKGFRKVCKVVTGLVLCCVFVVFAFSVYMQLIDDEVKGDRAVPKVVLSESMQYKHDENTYIKENDLDDQINMYDMIFMRQLPDEFDLELYDIVIYEYRDNLIIHRIIEIEEPNEEHPGVRHFMLRGDSNKYSDEYPVLYNQMKAIYKGERIKYMGSFFAFMQSVAGYLCIVLILFAVIATPIAEKKLWEAKRRRLKKIGVIPKRRKNISPVEQEEKHEK